MGQKGREPLEPAVDCGVVNLDPALGEQFFDAAVGDREVQTPADRQRDDLRCKQKPAEAERARSEGCEVASR
jgi:hypothetical protein